MSGGRMERVSSFVWVGFPEPCLANVLPRGCIPATRLVSTVTRHCRCFRFISLATMRSNLRQGAIRSGSASPAGAPVTRRLAAALNNSYNATDAFLVPWLASLDLDQFSQHGWPTVLQRVSGRALPLSVLGPVALFTVASCGSPLAARVVPVSAIPMLCASPSPPLCPMLPWRLGDPLPAFLGLGPRR